MADILERYFRIGAAAVLRREADLKRERSGSPRNGVAMRELADELVAEANARDPDEPEPAPAAPSIAPAGKGGEAAEVVR